MALGSRIYGLGVMALAVLGLAWQDFTLGQPVPKDIPYRSALACAAAALMLVAGAAVQWRRTAAWGAAVLGVYYALIVVVLMNGRVILAQYAEYGTYSGAAEEVAIAAGAIIVYAANAGIDATLSRRLTRLGQQLFGACAVLFGGAHFIYMNLTVPLVPKWLPPSQEFWAVATGIGHIAAGLAILTGAQARLAAILLTAMYASFTPFIHVPMLLADAASRMNWTENAINLVLTGVAWVVADSLTRRV
ncbi:MAG TPA: DoxX family membrane protein [Burkholderiales bacterium]|nr:DoxX family membrane protein [Burkholderiales bacterium]